VKEEDFNDHSGKISMSAFLRASHRLRSMSLVSGYILTQKGSLIAKLTIKKGMEGKQESKWICIMDSAEINVVFHPKYKRYQLDIVSTEEHTAFVAPKKEKQH
jgi:predicted RNA-binding protein associated with RNAse of E/G family